MFAISNSKPLDVDFFLETDCLDMFQRTNIDLSTSLPNSTPPYDGSEMDMDATNELFGELGDVFMNDSSNSSIVENKDDSESEAENENHEIDFKKSETKCTADLMKKCTVDLALNKNSKLLHLLKENQEASARKLANKRKPKIAQKCAEAKKVPPKKASVTDVFSIRKYKGQEKDPTESILCLAKNLEDKSLPITGPNSRNALTAKLNRERKKHRLLVLDSEVGALKDINSKLQVENAQYSDAVEKLQREVKYLRSVIANQSQISNILSAVSTVPGIQLSSTLQSNKKRSHSEDSGVPEPASKVGKDSCPVEGDEPVEGGICVHVSGQRVTIEMCAQCNNMHSTLPSSSTL